MAENSPDRCEGIGKTAGEMMETLWSMLNGYATSLREMNLGHRNDMLSLLLQSIARQMTRNIGKRV
jgi:hypothetical protein